MFQTGDMAILSGYGICRVTAVGHPKSAGADSKREYYTLVPEADGGTVHIPIDMEAEKLRHPMTRAEAMALIDSIPTVKVPRLKERTRLQRYKNTMAEGSPAELLRMIMEIHALDKTKAKGKGMTASDYLYRDAEKQLLSEMALALECTVEEVPAIIQDSIAAKAERGDKK